MITLIILFIDSFIKMFTNKGFIVSYDSAFIAGMSEIMITTALFGIYSLYKGFK